MYALYNGKFRIKIILAFMVVVFGFVSEVLVVFLMSLFKVNFDNNELTRNNYIYLGSALSKIIWFIFVKIIAYISRQKLQIKIALSEWIEIFAVPIGSMIICYAVIEEDYLYITINKVIIFSILFIINILTYFIYQKVQSHAEELMDSEMLRQQNEYYRLRFEDTEKQWKNLRKIRHDLKNHYVLEMSYLENKRYEELRELYLEELGELNRKNSIIESGSLGIDSILNYKVECAKEAGITVKHDIKVGGQVTISNGELNTLFGNLLDNAIEAVSKIAEDKREIELKLRIDETALLFTVRNPFDGNVKRNGKGEIVTSKLDKRSHGIGLKAVEEIVNRHKGTMHVECESAWFQVKVFLYMEENDKN